MTQDDFDEICREALQRYLPDFSEGSVDKVTHAVMKVVKNRIEAAEMNMDANDPLVRATLDEIREALGIL